MDDQRQAEEQDDEQRWWIRPENREWLRRYPTWYAEVVAEEVTEPGPGDRAAGAEEHG